MNKVGTIAAKVIGYIEGCHLGNRAVKYSSNFRHDVFALPKLTERFISRARAVDADLAKNLSLCTNVNDSGVLRVAEALPDGVLGPFESLPIFLSIGVGSLAKVSEFQRVMCNEKYYRAALTTRKAFFRKSAEFHPKFITNGINNPEISSNAEQRADKIIKYLNGGRKAKNDLRRENLHSLYRIG